MSRRRLTLMILIGAFLGALAGGAPSWASFESVYIWAAAELPGPVAINLLTALAPVSLLAATTVPPLLVASGAAGGVVLGLISSGLAVVRRWSRIEGLLLCLGVAVTAGAIAGVAAGAYYFYTDTTELIVAPVAAGVVGALLEYLSIRGAYATSESTGTTHG